MFFKNNKKTGIFGEVKREEAKNMLSNSNEDTNPENFGERNPFQQKTSFGDKNKSLFGNRSISPSTIQGKNSGGFGTISRDDEEMEDSQANNQSPFDSLSKKALRENSIKLNEEVNESIIRALSDKRQEQLQELKRINERKYNEVNVKKIGMFKETGSEIPLEIIKQPNFNRDWVTLNFKALQDFRKIIEQHHDEISKKFKSAKDSDKYILTEINLASLFFFCFHFVEDFYIPFWMREVVKIFSGDKKEIEAITKENIGSEVFLLIQRLEFEKAYEILTNTDERADIYEELSSIIYPIKQYFGKGFSQVYQKYEVSQIFENMTERARKLYTGL